MSFETIDRKSPEIMDALATATVFKKNAQVKARPAIVGEEVITILESGLQETTHIAQVNDWIVTNPSGEEYIISEQKFLTRYEVTDREGIYQAKGLCRAISNPFGKAIEIMASWGSPQIGEADCLIAMACDENGVSIDGEPYLIDGKAFAETYL